MAQRRSRRIAGLNPETIEDERCIFCLVDEKEGFNILRANVLRFSCCKKFAHRSCQEAWEKISSTCPHCRAEMQNGRNDEPPVAEPLAIVGVEPPLSPSRDDAINALFTTANDQALIQQRIDSFELFYPLVAEEFMFLMDTMSNGLINSPHERISVIIQLGICDPDTRLIKYFFANF
ncbi:hypothetical protein OS493_034473 [Desmophyllum pertusum]|uniref:RING-type domain-containing protein n=1 Tax=Desmophyllum pertusum TaxID=174260 RepID=A0A9X0CW37_9CNID|nr:hypothetical protein OS493_034473 [Desmophyllum pertusum]